MKLSWIKQFLSDELDALKIGLPLYFYILGSVTVSLQAINYFAARMGDGYLAGLGLGSAVTSASIFMFMLGFSSVFDVYGPQLCGQNKQKDLGKLLVKMLVQGFVAFKLVLFPYVLLVFCFDKIPLPEGNEHGKAQAIAQDFMYKMTITGYLDFVIETFIKFLVKCQSTISYGIILYCPWTDFINNCILLVFHHSHGNEDKWTSFEFDSKQTSGDWFLCWSVCLEQRGLEHEQTLEQEYAYELG